jgi:NAD(P)-dependent dehydrogenase (short-subunit alcohol dehydrogenase family)
MGRLDDKTAIVTGGATGIGRAIAERFVAEGAQVVVTARRSEPLEALEGRHPGRIAQIASDVAARGDPARVVAFALERFGRLDVLVNNAGLFVKKPLAETTDDEIGAMLDVNVRGVLAFAREASDALERTRGAIINISSAAGIYAKPNLAAYAASKAAVHQLTRVLAVELGPRGVRVNAIAPGLVRSEMTAPIFADEARLGALLANTALGRAGEPEDIANAALFLASDQGAWITGQTIAASGGLFL